MARGEFTWNELMTRDVEAACRFHGELLGWTFERKPSKDGLVYVVASANGRPVAGIFDPAARNLGHIAPHRFSHIAVDDVDELFARAMTLGGSAVRPPHDFPGVGRIAYLADSTGAEIGWRTPSPETT